MKLEKFNNKKKIIIRSILFVGVVIIGMVIFRSYAFYKDEKETNIANEDVKLAYTINGEKNNEAFPSKTSGYEVNSVTCKNGVTASWNQEKWGLSNIESNGNQKVQCSIDFVEIDNFSRKVKVGDYVEMTPTLTSYTISSSLTGYTTNQTINPSELNLWRVIKKNEDGTIEMVSEDVSSTKVYFRGRTGYLRFVKALNEIANSYQNSAYTVNARNIGYSSQTEEITDTSKISSTAPWTTNTSNNDNELVGGGDTLYETDTALVQNIYKTLNANQVGTDTVSGYWVASRAYYYIKSTHWGWYGRVATTGNKVGSVDLHYYINNNFGDGEYAYAIRPIVILKDGLKAKGSGTSNDHWKLVD